MRILIACDKFKGSLDAPGACAAIARGLRKHWPDAEITECPIADGGEGFVNALAGPLHGRWIDAPAHDALGRPVTTRYLVAETGGTTTAIMEMAEASGLWRIAPHERDPLHSDTRGTGEMIRHAIEHSGAQTILLGIGGSATNDGGAGMAAALGVRFLNANGETIAPTPAILAQHLESVNTSGLLPLPRIQVACDVDSPLLGPLGATRVFGPQKGADETALPILETALEAIVRCSGGREHATRPGAGAAGGLGFGLLHFAGAELVPGFERIAELTDLEKQMETADLIITGEGSLDAQTLSGQGPIGIARLAKKHGKPVWAFCGRADQAARNSGNFDRITDLASTGLPHDILFSQTARLLEELAAQVR